MKNKIIITAFAVLTVVGVYTLSENMDMAANDAIAGTVAMTNTTINATCSGSTADGDYPTAIAADMGVATTVISSNPTYSPGNATLTGGVDGQTTSNGTEAFSLGTPGISGITAGRALFNVEGPNGKVGGFQCQTTTAAGFEIKQGDTLDDADLSVTADDLDGLNDVAYDGTPFDDSSTGVVIFGASGQSGANVSDATDRKGIEEGEVSFGGIGATSTGSYMFQFSQKVTNRTAGTVDVEVLALTYNY